MTTLVSAPELNGAIHQGSSLLVLASHWFKDGISGRSRFQAAHIPTAQFCDPAFALIGLPGSAVGRNPLPAVSNLQGAINSWGLRTNRPVVVYDDGRGLFAARAWWTLSWAGVPDVRILDGGLQHWEFAGYDSVGGPGNMGTASDTSVSPGAMPVATVEDVRSRTGVLLDTREPNRFAGRREILDLKAGHIPGAVNFPLSNLLNQDNSFRTASEIRDAFAAVGVTHDSAAETIVYSGSGIHSSLALAAMSQAGLPVATHFVGGWSQWSADPDNPIDIGD